MSLPQPTMRCLTPDDPAYPQRLKEIPDSPERLYVIGDLPRDDLPSVAIVGARLCDHYGRNQALYFGRELAAHGIQIISGMAAGIDGTSQRGALEAKGRTFAVLGCGADVCYPQGNRDLYDLLTTQGGILSELPPGSPPERWHFPRRNRIISGLADIVLVIEARQKSGSLITVDCALDQGKSVFAVPGRIDDHLSDGCNRLIYQGAGIAYGPEAILDEFDRKEETLPMDADHNRAIRRLKSKEKRVLTDSTLSQTAKQVYSALSFSDETSLDTLLSKTNLPISQVSAALIQLIMRGAVAEVLPDFYIRESRF